MQIGMIGLGRMGANMVTRLMRDGHDCIVFDNDSDAVRKMQQAGARGADSLETFCSLFDGPKRIWIMVPASVVARVLEQIEPLLSSGDILVDGGNSNYREAVDHSRRLASRDIDFLDCGTSGGVFGLERGYCLMIGGETRAVEALEPVFRSLAPGSDKPQASPAEQGYLHCGCSGAGHFVKMVHNGIEYALMAAYSEGFNLLKHAGIGRQAVAEDAETAPFANAGYYQYDMDLGEIAEVWRHGSVISSWLLDLTAAALSEDNGLQRFSGRVSDSGEGRWTCQAAIETGTPAPLITTALFERFSSRGEGDFANRLLSAMRYQFGGHHEKQE